MARSMVRLLLFYTAVSLTLFSILLLRSRWADRAISVPAIDITTSLVALQRNFSEVEGVAITLSPSFPIAFPYVLYNLLEKLPKNWVVVCVTERDETFHKKEKIAHLLSRATNAHRDRKSISILPLLPPHSFSIPTYCCYLMSPHFYEGIPAEHILIFQWDSLLIQQDDYKNDRKEERYQYLRDFFDYPYIGAPWNWRKCREHSHIDGECRDGGNGGFSLRRRSAMINITSSPDFNPEYSKDKGCGVEDLILSAYLRHNHYLSLAPRDVGRKFSMETIFSPNALGAHKPWEYIHSYPPNVHLLADLNAGAEERAQKWLSSVGLSEIWNDVREIAAKM